MNALQGGATGPSGVPGPDPEFSIRGRRVAKKWVALALLVLQNTLLVLLMRFSRVQGSSSTSGGGMYLVSTAVVVAEALKVVMCLGSLVSKSGVRETRNMVAQELRGPDMARLAVPGLLYLVQNNLLFVALSNLDAAVYQVTYQLKILTTAMFSVGMMGKRLSSVQVVSLVVLMVGVALVQLSETRPSAGRAQQGDQDQLLGLMCVLVSCLTSGYAGVYLERILKQRSRNVTLEMRNILLGGYGVLFGFITILGNAKDRETIAARGFLFGYTGVVWIVVLVQALGGLLIAAVMQFADNILKGFATSVSIVLSCVVSLWLFDFHLSGQFLVGTGLVILAVMLYAEPAIPWLTGPLPQGMRV